MRLLQTRRGWVEVADIYRSVIIKNFCLFYWK